MKLIRAWILVCAFFISSCAQEVLVKSHPDADVVFIVIDTLREVDLPLDGNSPATAPFLDTLALESVVFDNAWSTSAWTAPATASIFTSRYPNEHGVTIGFWEIDKFNQNGGDIELNRLPKSIESLPVFMKSQGYTTFAVTANLNIDEPMGFNRGFDHFFYIKGSRNATANRVKKEILNWKEEIQGAEKAFLYLHFMDPHHPYTRHERWISDSADPPENSMDDHVAYRSEIRNVDENLREIFEALDLGEDTIIILTSDHGEEFKEHGANGHSHSLYSELTRVPLLLHIGADGPRGRSYANVSNLDLLPTLRELLLSPASPQERGESLLSVLDETERGSRSLFSMLKHVKPKRNWRMRSVVRSQYKLIEIEHSNRLLLFDIESDPGEKVNLAERKPKIVEALRLVLDAQEARASETAVIEPTIHRLEPEEIEQLKMLGYTVE
jgi:arylsulfatase A-like enzyme